MQNWPDPECGEMGQLVDQWLVSLRNEELNERQLKRVARRLGRASERGWKGKTKWEREDITRFTNWLCDDTPITTGSMMRSSANEMGYQVGDVR